MRDPYSLRFCNLDVWSRSVMSRLALAKKSFDWCAFCWLPLGPVLLSVFARNDLVCVRGESADGGGSGVRG